MRLEVSGLQSRSYPPSFVRTVLPVVSSNALEFVNALPQICQIPRVDPLIAIQLGIADEIPERLYLAPVSRGGAVGGVYDVANLIGRLPHRPIRKRKIENSEQFS